MSLRTRLLLAVGGLLAVALVVFGVLVVGLTRQNLVEQVDNDLQGAQSFADLGLDGRPADVTGRRYAAIIFNNNSEQVGTLNSGRGGAPDSPPALPAGGISSLPLGQVIELTSQDGSIQYRAIIRRAHVGPINGIILLAAPMSAVNAYTFSLVRALVVVGVTVLVIALVVGWFLIRRGLRPLEQVTATATRISAGDLSQRTGVMAEPTEVGRLGHAFDTMLDQIQGAFEDQQRSERKLRQFVADASHELRTPLTTLRGYSDLYHAGGLAEDAALEQAMMRIGTESRRMADLVEDMLLLARLDQGRPLDRESVSMSELVEDAVNDARAIEPDRPITAHVAGDVTVVGDEDRLRQVVGNLLANVRVHTQPSTPVDVALSVHNGRCSFVVSDHGPGVDSGHVAHIFDRFYRADAGRSRDSGGSGLGLAIAASIVEAHGGSIAYTDTAGGGATFTAELPRANVAQD